MQCAQTVMLRNGQSVTVRNGESAPDDELARIKYVSMSARSSMKDISMESLDA